MKIALLGGSFNPVHKGHIFIAEQVVEKLKYDSVILVPASISPFKQGAGADKTADIRLSLLLAAIEGRRRMTIDDCELLRGGVSYTIETIKDIIERFRPSGKLGLVVGDDLADDFLQWKDAESILSLCDVIIARRLPNAAAPQFPHIALNNEPFDISSSMVRSKITKGEKFKHLVPESRGLFIEAALRDMMSPARFLHSWNTARMAEFLARRFGLNAENAFVAGLSHDVAREVSLPLEHGKAGAAYIKSNFGIVNKYILEAVECHTEGKKDMGDLAKVVFIADKIEPRRRLNSAKLRDLAKTESLDTLFRETVQDQALYLQRSGIALSKNGQELLDSLGLAASGF